MAGKRVRGRVNRQMVVETAIGIFNSQGYDRTSMNDIASALGITKAGLYHYFASKEEIFVAGLEAASTLIGNTLGDLDTVDLTALERVENFIRSYGNALADPIFRCLILADYRILGPAAQEAIRNCKRRHQRQCERLLQGMGLNAADARSFSLTIFGTFNWSAFAFGDNIGRELESQSRMLIRLVRSLITG